MADRKEKSWEKLFSEDALAADSKENIEAVWFNLTEPIKSIVRYVTPELAELLDGLGQDNSR